MAIKDTQYVIVRHHNTPNPHCHLIFNRVDNSGTRIPQGISFTRDGTTFKGSSLDRNLSFSKIDNVLTDGMNIGTGG